MACEIKDVKIASETDCMDNCSSKVHGKEVCSIGTGILTDAVVALWVKKCSNYAHVMDQFGRNCLHIAASTGNHDALGWLIKRVGSDLDKKDKISGYTALHRSIYFGQIHIARSLIKYNADINLKDNEGMSPLELCHADRPWPFEFKIRSDPTELFVWGTNDNYTLGNTIQQARPAPEQVELFRKNNTRIMQAVLCTYHSVFLSQSGEAFVCGSGRGGKLGLGHESSVLTPEMVQLKSTSKCVQIAAGVDHTIFLMDNNKVLSCGSNEYGLVGHKPQIKELLSPKHIDFSQKATIKGILAARYHSIFYTSRKIFTCGANRGQLGHSAEKGPIIYEPKLISQIVLDPEGDAKFTHLATSDHAIAARTSAGLVYLLHRFDCHKINTKHFNVEKLQVVGGSFGDSLIQEKSGKSFKEDISYNDKPLTLLMLTITGRIVIWREPSSVPSGTSNGTFSRLIFNTGRSTLDISDFCCSQSCLMLVTTSGEAYKSVWKPTNTPILSPSFQQKAQKAHSGQTDFKISSGSRRTQKSKDCSVYSICLEHVKLQRIKNINAAGNITCDSQGKNFAIIQASPKLDLTELPELKEPTINLDIAKFRDEASEEDCLHDLLFRIGNNRFPAHRFIIASSCPKLNSMVLKIAKTKPNEKPVIVPIENINSKVFEYVLQYLYSNTCDLMSPGKRVVGSTDWVKITIEAARKLELENMCKELRKVEIVDEYVMLKRGESLRLIPVKRFSHNGCEDLADIVLQNPDGYSIRAHRCILVARMEYFHSMLYANSWLEKDSSKPLALHLSKVAMETLLDYTYTDDAPNLPLNDFNGLSEILAMSDTFFMERLRTIIESALIDLLTLKNVASMLYLADRCNARQLRESCMQFISLNLSAVLENRILDPLPLDIVKALSEYYCSFHPIIHRRSMRSALDTSTLSEYETELMEMPPDLLNELQLCSQDEEIKKPQSKTNKTRLRLRSRNSECETDTPNNANQSNVLPTDLKSSPTTIMEHAAEKGHGVVESPSQQLNQPIRKLAVPTPSQTMMSLKNLELEASINHNVKLNPSDFPTLLKHEEENSSKILTTSNRIAPQSPPSGQSTEEKQPLRNSVGSINTSPRSRTTSGSTPGSAKKKIRWKTISISDEQDQDIVNEAISPNTKNNLRDPVNPWKKSSDTEKVAFREIVQEEVEKKDNFERATTKSLYLMQIEDQAINELMDNYNSKDVQDGIELVEVERVCSKNYANPTWVQHQHSSISSAHWPKFTQ